MLGFCVNVSIIFTVVGVDLFNSMHCIVIIEQKSQESVLLIFTVIVFF